MSEYFKKKKFFDRKLASCFVYWLKPGGIEKQHYHKGIEFVYVMKGSCQTHQQGKLYIYKNGQVHEVIRTSSITF